MATATHRRPSFQLVNSVGTAIEGPYDLSVVQGSAPSALGITLETIDAWEEARTIGPFENFQFSQVSFPLGYKLHATLKFTAVESDTSSSTYGLTLLHRLWMAMIATQLSYSALQFRMFATAPWRGVVHGSSEWHPQLMAGKQAFYTVEFPIISRDLVPTPGEWAQSLW